MVNSITEGRDRELPPDGNGEIKRAPTPAAVELKSEVMAASRLREAGQADATRASSSIESRADLRVAASNEASRVEPSIVENRTPLIDQETARQWADLDASDFGRIRSAARRDKALDAIGGHMLASIEYAGELTRRLPTLAEEAQATREERGRVEQAVALPAIQHNAAELTLPSTERHPTDRSDRELAQQDARSLAALHNTADRHAAAAVVGENARHHPAYRDELRQVAPQLAREAEVAASDRDAVRSVERRSAAMAAIPRDALRLVEAREIVKDDVAAIGLVKDHFSRYQAAVSIGDNAANQPMYRAELQRQAPEVAAEARAATVDNERQTTDKETHKEVELAAMQVAKSQRAAAWTPTQAADSVRADVAAWRAAVGLDRQSVVADMIVAREANKSYEKALVKVAPDVAAAVESQHQREAADRKATEQRSERIAAAAQTRAAMIDAAALAAVAGMRTRDAARVAEQLNRPLTTSEQQRRNAHQRLKAPPLDGRVTAPDDPDIAAQAARAIKRPAKESDLSDSLLTRYLVTHGKQGLFDKGATEFVMRAGDRQGQTAFVDTGKAIHTERDDQTTIRAMVEVATSKRWNEVTVSGTDEFRRKAWLEASLAGLEVRGYAPRQAEKQLLAEQLERRPPVKVEPRPPVNAIISADREVGKTAPDQRHRGESQRHIDGEALSPQERNVLDQSRSILNAKALGPQFAEATMKDLEAKLRGDRVYVGQVLEHGRAPYKFDKDNDLSYFVALKTAKGEQVIWGKGLAEAMQSRQVGEQVVLRNVGKQDVVVDKQVRNEDGVVVGIRPKDTHLNAWKVEPLSQYSEKARSDLVNRDQGRQPSFGVYDAKAPRVTEKNSQQDRERESRRSTEQQRADRAR